MVFGFLFRPRWKHRDPQVRREAVRELNLDDAEQLAILLKLAGEDPDPMVRQNAVRRLVDFEILARVAETDGDATVREHALQRLTGLVAGTESPAPELAQRQAYLERTQDRRVLELVARAGVEAALRWQAAGRVNKESLFAEMARTDADAQQRLRALEQIEQEQTLKRLYEQVRTKDKTLRQAIQTRLEKITASRVRPQQIREHTRQLWLKAEGLVAAAAGSADPQRLRSEEDGLSTQWRDLRDEWQREGYGEWDAQLEKRFEEALRQFGLRLSALEQARHADEQFDDLRDEKRRIIATLETLIAGSDAEQGAEDVTQLQGFVRRANEDWTALAALPEKEEAQLQRRFAELNQTLRGRVEALDLRGDVLGELRDLTMALEAWLAKPDPHAKKAISEAEKWLKRQSQPFADEILNNSRAALAEMVALATAKRDELTNAYAKALESVRACVERLAQQLDDGQTDAAGETNREIRKLMDSLPPKERQRATTKGFWKQYQKLAAQVRELHDWRTWGTTPAREALCEEMEKLATAAHNADQDDYDFDGVAAVVKDARKRWRDLGPAEAGTEALWARFDEACNRAYAPCQAHFEQQGAVRTHNANQRIALCEELEAFALAADGGGDDWKALDKRVREAQQRWREIGPVDRKAHRETKERFDAAINPLKERLAAVFEANAVKKEALVKRADKIAAEIDAGQTDPNVVASAVEQIKQIQQQWKDIGRAKGENALWQQLRGAADKVFAARQAGFDFAAQERDAAKAARVGICEQIEQLATRPSEELNAVVSEYAQAKQAWAQGPELSKRDDASLQKRYAQACRALETHIRESEADQVAQRRARLLERAGLCTRLETVWLQFGAGECDQAKARQVFTETRRRWEALPTEEDSVVRRISERWQTVAARLGECLDEDSQHCRKLIEEVSGGLAENTAAREMICVRGEVLADIDSPADAREARMNYQVSQLAASMQGGAPTIEEREGAFDELLESWCTSAPVAYKDAQRLDSRFAKICKAFMGEAPLSQSAVA